MLYLIIVFTVSHVLYLIIVYIEDIYLFEMNTKYISSSVLKTSEFSRVHSTSVQLTK